jgi:hypothetical protein
MNITSTSIDLGKTTFHLIALDQHGKRVIQFFHAIAPKRKQ